MNSISTPPRMWGHSFTGWTALVVLALLLMTPTAMAQDALSGVVINEVLVDPNSTTDNFDTDGDGTAETDDEFIELYNMSGAAVDISGWELYDDASLKHTFAPGSILGAGGFVAVVGAYDPGPAPVGYVVASSGSLGLSNSGDTVYLRDPVADAWVFAVFNGDTPSSPPPGTQSGSGEDFGSDVDGNSIQRQPDGSTTFSVTTPTPAATNGNGTGSGMLVVTTDADELNSDGDCSLREAVQAANTDAIVDMCDGTSGEEITFASAYTIALSLGEILVTDGVSISAFDTPGVVIDGNNASRLFDIDAPGEQVVFSALTLQNGHSGMGGSSAPNAGGAVDLKSGSNAIFNGVNVLNSTAGINGGGIHGAGNTLIEINGGGQVEFASLIQGNVAAGNDAGMGGGGVWGAGTVTISGDVTIDGNSATGTAGSGGGVFNFGGVLTITDATISNNTANRAGGGIEDFGDADDDTDVTLTNVTLSGNSITTAAPGNGGGLHSGGGEVIVVGGLVNGNSAVEGGGLWASGSLTVDGTTITGNMATGDADEAFEGGGGVFNQGGTVMISNATISENTAVGVGASGGGVFTNDMGALIVDASSITGNSSLRAGGGIEVNGGTVTLTDTDFTANTTGDSPGNGGALHVTKGTVTATGGTVSGNTASSEGGGFWNNAGWTMTVTGTSFTGNTASGAAADNGGGGLFNNGGVLALNEVVVTGNKADGTAGSGGGLFNGPGGTMTVTGGTIQSNEANRAGGGIEDAGGTVTLLNVIVDQNLIAVAAPGNGGGLHSGGGNVTIRGGRYTSNSAVEGGGLWSNGTLTVMLGDDNMPTTIWNNEATGIDGDAKKGGGGVFAKSGADITLNGVLIDGNRATSDVGSGGGIFVDDNASVTMVGGQMTLNEANRAGGGIEIADDGATEGAGMALLTEVTVMGNLIVEAKPGNGGGLHIGGAASATVERSTFANNLATEGGGLWVSGSGALAVHNSTVTNNAATEDGGGVYGVDGATIELVSATVADNTAGGNGGGLGQGVQAIPTFGLTNTILANNVAVGSGNDCFGTYRSGDYNLIEDMAGCTLTDNTTNNVSGQDPMLNVLADNGGPTQTRALPATSPAVDAGQTQVGVDQRGFARNVGQADIGAFEFGATDDGGATLACSMEASVSFSEMFDTDGNDPDFGEYATLLNGGAQAVDLTSCSFATFDPQSERVVYTAVTNGVLLMDYTLATMNGDQGIPAGSIPDGPGAIVVLEGTATVGATVADVLDNVVAAVVYRAEGDVFASMSGGGTPQQRADQRAEFVAALARLSQPVASENEAGGIDLAVTAAPNPLRDRTTVAFGVTEAADVRVSVYDALGRQVALLAEAPYAAGRHEVTFDARDLPAGVYVIRSTVGAESRTARVTVTR